MDFNKRINAEMRKCSKSDRYQFTQVSDCEFSIKFATQNKESIYNNQDHTIIFKTTYGNGEDCYQYPKDRPLVRFASKIWHPNIGYNDGTICIDILNDSDKWTPLQSFDSIFTSIIILLDNPNLDSPQELEACNDFKKFIDSNGNIINKSELIKLVDSKYSRNLNM
jgi:ubiquitin-protein ligase